jgi:CNT family concentrative nucleoside transporter
MMALLGTSGAETLSAVANVFMGQIEAPLVIKPYLAKMTTSELFAVMVGGMATISGSLMAIYIGFGADSVAILTTSVMAAPCSLYLAKLLIPETGTPVTVNMVKTAEDKKHRNVIDAATDGAGEGMKLAINILAMLIAFIALIELVNTLLRYFPTNTSLPNWLAATDDPAVGGAELFWLRLRKYVSTLLGFGIIVWVLRWPFLRVLKLLRLDDEYRDWKNAAGLVRFAPTVLGYFLFLGAVDILMRTLPANLGLGEIFATLFYPLALLMGIEEKDAGRVASLLGTKLATNEFVAFLDLKTTFADHQISPRSFRLATYALTGFANFASIGIQLGGIGAMAPERRPELARLGLAALFVGFLVTILNAAIAGVLLPTATRGRPCPSPCRVALASRVGLPVGPLVPGRALQRRHVNSRPSNGSGNKSASRRRSVTPVKLAKTTSTSPQNSQRICRHAPHGGVGAAVSVTTATALNCPGR